MPEKSVRVTNFKGLNNKQDRGSLSAEWLEVADDIDIDDANKIRRAPGYTQSLTGISQCYNTRRGDDAYLIGTDRALKRFDGTQAVQIYADAGDGPYQWTEYGTSIYLLGSTKALEIRPHEVVTWGVEAPALPSISVASGDLEVGTYQLAFTYLRDDGIESGAIPIRITVAANSRIQLSNIPLKLNHKTVIYASAPNGKELYEVTKIPGAVGASTGAYVLSYGGYVLSYGGYVLASGEATATATTSSDAVDGDHKRWTTPLKTLFYQPPPLAGHICEAYDGKLWVGVHDDLHNVTRLLDSQRLRHFELDPAIPYDITGKVTMLARVAEGMIIRTDREIKIMSAADDGGYMVTELANYGGGEGGYDWTPENTLGFWTQRGLMQGMPLAPITEKNYSIAPGINAAAMVREIRGYRVLMVSHDESGVSHNPYGTKLTPTTLYDATS